MATVVGGADDAEESARAVTTARASADRLRVVPQQMGSRIEQPRELMATPPLCQKPEHILLGLSSRRPGPAEGCALGRRDESHDHNND